MNFTTLRPHTVPLVLAAICIALALGGDHTHYALRYDRDAILAGEFWRIFTGNFLHLGWIHLVLNLAGLALIWAFFNALFTTRQWLAIVVVTASGTGLGLLWLDADLGAYVGLSGALHGYFTAGCVREIRRGQREGRWLLGAVVLKLIWEQWQGAMPGTAALAGGEVIVNAHLYGAIIGLAAVLLRTRSQATAL